MKKDRLIWIAGLVGILAALVTALSDMILLGRPVSAYAFFKLGTESMAELDHWRILAGTFLGVFALPFQIMGAIPLYFGLRSAGRKLAAAVFGTAAYALIMGVAFHVSYAYIGSGWSMNYGLGAFKGASTGLMATFDLYWRIIITVIVTGLLASSLFYIYLVLTGRTAYPKWMAVLNPVVIFLGLLPLILLIPAPAGGYIAPAYLNLAVLFFFILALKNISGKKVMPGGNNKY